jgi:NAD(P)H-nitrite reductase large subunit
MFSIGEIRSDDGSYTSIDDRPDGNYRMFMLHDGVMIGALLVGDLRLMGACRTAIENRKQIAEDSSIEEIIASITTDQAVPPTSLSPSPDAGEAFHAQPR